MALWEEIESKTSVILLKLRSTQDMSRSNNVIVTLVTCSFGANWFLQHSGPSFFLQISTLITSSVPSLFLVFVASRFLFMPRLFSHRQSVSQNDFLYRFSSQIIWLVFLPKFLEVSSAQAVQLPVLSVQYQDYAFWQRQWMAQASHWYTAFTAFC